MIESILMWWGFLVSILTQFDGLVLICDVYLQDNHVDSFLWIYQYLPNHVFFHLKQRVPAKKDVIIFGMTLYHHFRNITSIPQIYGSLFVFQGNCHWKTFMVLKKSCLRPSIFVDLHLCHQVLMKRYWPVLQGECMPIYWLVFLTLDGNYQEKNPAD